MVHRKSRIKCAQIHCEYRVQEVPMECKFLKEKVQSVNPKQHTRWVGGWVRQSEKTGTTLLAQHPISLTRCILADNEQLLVGVCKHF